jgi:GTP diphosphokinase / guanosine-3',5'-bis(diphosphate) 3'-diphosphatase
MNIETLMEILPENYTPSDRESILRAYEFAEKAHSGQKRASGEPYITHCVAVAGIIAELKMPPSAVIAAILHDTVEDTSVTLDDIRNLFNDDIAKLVDGVTKLTNLPRVSRGDQHPDERLNGKPADTKEDATAVESEQTKKTRNRDLRNETLRKTFIAMGEDIRIVLIKLADRLHNMRTLHYMPESKRKRIAQETLDIFAPLANRLGIWQIKGELEDLAFRYVNPTKYTEIAEKIEELNIDRDRQIKDIITRLKTVLDQSGIKAEVKGRPKHIYSIYRKMLSKNKPFEMVRDLRGVRLIVPDIPSCYTALGIIHTHWRPIPQEFDDYIAAPKDNFYQSLHTAIIYDDGKPLEVQIRTYEMDHSAEYGIAAHWKYKERGKNDESYEQRINWLRKMMEWRQDVSDPQEFVDSMKTDVFQDRVYVFTPKGDIIDLPTGSTPIDLAYHVHTEIGNRCRGAKINGKLVNLDYVLKTGDQIEILTAKQGGPSRDWLNPNLELVTTQRAKLKIRQWFKKQDHDQNLTQGKIILERELKRLGLNQIDPKKIETLATSFEYPDIEDFYIALGCGDLSLSRIINKLSEIDKEEPLFQLKQMPDAKKTGDDFTVLGIKGLLTTIGRCCNPAPGDQIIGYITRGRGATIHRQDCPNILRIRDKERLIKVAWGGEPQQTYPVSIEIKAYDRQGLMSDISTILKEENVNVIDISLKVSQNFATFFFVLEVGDINQLSRVLTRIETLPNVMETHRIKPG